MQSNAEDENVKMSKCQNAKMPKCQNAYVPSLPIPMPLAYPNNAHAKTKVPKQDI